MNTRALFLLALTIFSFVGGWFVRDWTGEPELTVVPPPALEPIASTLKPVGEPVRAETTEPTRQVEVNAEGVGESVALTQSPHELLALIYAESVNSSKRATALQGLVAQWIQSDASLTEQQKKDLHRLMLKGALEEDLYKSDAVALSRSIARLSDPLIRDAWKSEHAFAADRAEIFAAFARADLQSASPEQLMQQTSEWTPWERSHYRNAVLETLAYQNPEQGLAWLQADPDAFSPESIDELYRGFAGLDFEKLESSFTSIENPRLRESALKALTASMIADTRAAVEWADSLSNEEDQAMAHELIYEATPRGIGVLLSQVDGFPTVSKAIRTDTGVQTGDRIVSVSTSDGIVRNLYGESLKSAAELIAGEAGTNITLEVLRTNPNTGKLEQTQLTITRQQLILGG